MASWSFENRDPLKGYGNYTLKHGLPHGVYLTLKTETRLKGMETQVNHKRSCFCISFENRDPLKGDGNL